MERALIDLRAPGVANLKSKEDVAWFLRDTLTQAPEPPRQTTYVS